MGRTGAGSIAAGLLLLAACGSGGEVEGGLITSFEDVAGVTYELQDGERPSFFYFFADGTTWHVARDRDSVVESPSAVLEATFGGTQASLTEVRGLCGTDSSAAYTIRKLNNGNLRLTLIEDTCEFRALFFPGEWAPVP